MLPEQAPNHSTTQLLENMPPEPGDELVTIRRFERVEPALERLSDTYTALVEGIHHDTHYTEVPPQLITRPSVYINGAVVATESRLTIGYTKEELSYAKSFRETRKQAYTTLVDTAVKSGDFSLLLGVIESYKDPAMAKMLLHDMNLEKERYPDMIAGSADRIISQINAHNRWRKAIKNAVRAHARRQRNFDLRRRLYSDDTGLVGAISIGATIRWDGQLKKYLDKVFYDPLNKIAALAPLEEQILSRERSAWSTNKNLDEEG